MLDFFSNYIGTIIISAVLLLIVILIIVKLVKNKKAGQTSCGCDCADCPSKGMCHKD